MLRFKNRESLFFFFFFLACAFSLSGTHLRCCCVALPIRDYLTFGSFMFWLGEVRFGAREVVVSLLCCKCMVDWCCGETCRWRQREETCRCDRGGFVIWGKRRDLGFMICCRWLIFVSIYANVVFTFSCMKNMKVSWW